MRAIERTDVEASFIRTTISALEPCLRFRPTIPASAIQAFLLVAGKEGLSVGEYAKRASVPVTTMSRHLLDLGPRLRNLEVGAGLIESRQNLMNLRETLYHLTPKGRALLATMMRVGEPS